MSSGNVTLHVELGDAEGNVGRGREKVLGFEYSHILTDQRS